jgi:hypothetical protein
MGDFSGRLWGGQHWPVIQRFQMRFPAGTTQEIQANRPHLVNVYFTVTSGVCEVYLWPQQPAVDQPDFVFAAQPTNNPILFGPGEIRFTVRAANDDELKCNIVMMRGG